MPLTAVTDEVLLFWTVSGRPESQCRYRHTLPHTRLACAPVCEGWFTCSSIRPLPDPEESDPEFLTPHQPLSRHSFVFAGEGGEIGVLLSAVKLSFGPGLWLSDEVELSVALTRLKLANDHITWETTQETALTAKTHATQNVTDYSVPGKLPFIALTQQTLLVSTDNCESFWFINIWKTKVVHRRSTTQSLIFLAINYFRSVQVFHSSAVE